MATTKVSELSALTTPDGAEELLINDGGTSKKITIANAIIAGTGITKSGATISASPVALTTIQTAANQSAQLALTAQEGDVVVRSDENKTYMHNGGSAGSMSDYTLMATPTDAVTSVVGQTGVVSTAQIKTALEDGIDSVHYVDGSIDTAHIADLQVTTAKIAADAITGAKIADDAVDSEHYAAGSIDTAHIADDQITAAKMADNSIDSDMYVDGSIDTAHIGDDQVTADKLANSINTEITANTAKVTNATHSGEVTGATALTIADDVVDEANLKISNAGSNGQFLSKQSGDTGGLTWADVDALPSQSSQSGKYLTTNGSAASWATLDTDANTTTKGLYEHEHTIDANYSISSGSNGMSAGPITISSGVSVTVPTGSTWVIV